MKKILYIIDDGKRNFTYERISGFCETIHKLDEPVNVYIFRSTGLGEYDDAHNQGEYNIYHLPDFSEFDGIVLDINNTSRRRENVFGSKGAAYAVARAEKSGKPVIGIANRIRDFYYLGIDNCAAMTSVIAYLHEDLKITSFWFIMGPPDNYENIVRTEALRNYCVKNGLPAEPDCFYAENYGTETGTHGFRKLYELHLGKLPEAVICANDMIARGAIEEAARYGLTVPRDFLVTGFDNLDISAYLSPTLTTVDQFRYGLGEPCLEIFRKLWRGEEVDRITYTPTKVIRRETTGAQKPSDTKLQERLAEALEADAAIEDFQNQLCEIQYTLPECNSIIEMCHCLEKCIRSFHCKAFYLVMDSRLYDYSNQIELDQDTGIIQTNRVALMTEGYPETMELIYVWREDTGSSQPRTKIKGLFPTFDTDQGGCDFLFVPLHFKEEAVGYLAVQDCVELLKTRNIAPVANTLTMAMRSFFAGKRLEYLSQMLSGVSMQDNLTGLYNRLGYHHLAQQLFRRVHSAGEHLGVIFFDMDGMKYINDTYGHACGDDAIRSVAMAITDNMVGDTVSVRYGGDEFLAFTPAPDVAAIEALIQRILKSVSVWAEKLKVPCVPGVSAGYVLTDLSSQKQLKDYVEEADGRMYEEKKRKKVKR